jgi:hypothetical protein
MFRQQGANNLYELPGVVSVKENHRSSFIGASLNPGHPRLPPELTFQVPQGTQRAVSFDVNPVQNHVQAPRATSHQSSWGQQDSSSNTRRDDSLYHPDQNPTTAASLSNGHHGPLPDHRDVPQRAPSSSVSSRSQRSASTTGSRSGGPQPLHLPKHLVMPTPLQQDVGLQRQTSHRAQPHSSFILPDSRSGLNRTTSQARAQDIPMLPNSRKLRKRTGSPEHTLPPTQFTAAPVSSVNVGASHMNNNKNRVHKRLSKRRNDL